ncbi:MAG: ADP-ribose polymerase [Bacteroidota bacterium]
MSSPAPDRRPAVRLVMVTGANNNKVYEMAENGDGTFTARYGRIGARLQEKTYPSSRWDATYRAKTRKGYTDVTALAAEASERGFAIDDPGVAALVDRLQAAADAALRAQYLVAPDAVSARQVAQAQAHLDALGALAHDLSSPEASGEFDARLLELFTTIPRTMGDVRDFQLAERLEASGVPDLLAAEQEALDRMAQRVRLNTAPVRPTLMDALGVDLRPVTDERTLRRIRKKMGDRADQLVRAVEIVHPRLQERFEAHVAGSRQKRTRLLWHGSRTENWLSILETGLCLHPDGAVISGKMFGYGLYFAPSFKKSLGYTSLRGAYWTGHASDRGVLALYDVHVGRPLRVDRYEGWCGSLTATRLALKGGLLRRYDSIHARAGEMLLHDEIVIYREAQACPRYLVEVNEG